jgi:LEA14-like dessication related protein
MTRLLPFILVAFAAGCAAPKPVEKAAAVSAETEKLVDRDQTLGGFQAVATVRVKNTGDLGATASAARYELVVDGKVTHKGELTVSAELPAGGEADLEVPVPYEYARTEEELLSLAQRKEPLSYAVRGVILTSGGEVEFAKAGAARTPRLPLLSLETIEAVNRKSEGLDVTAIVDLENPNPFPVPLKGLSWKLSLGGQPAAEGVLGKKDVVKAASHIKYEISVHLEAEKVKDRKELTAGGSVGYVLEGELDVGLTRVPLSSTGQARLLRYSE